MLNIPRQKTLKQSFDESVKALEQVTRKAQLLRMIEERSREAETASSDESLRILADLKEYREQITRLEQ